MVILAEEAERVGVELPPFRSHESAREELEDELERILQNKQKEPREMNGDRTCAKGERRSKKTYFFVTTVFVVFFLPKEIVEISPKESSAFSCLFRLLPLEEEDSLFSEVDLLMGLSKSLKKSSFQLSGLDEEEEEEKEEELQRNETKNKTKQKKRNEKRTAKKKRVKENCNIRFVEVVGRGSARVLRRGRAVVLERSSNGRSHIFSFALLRRGRRRRRRLLLRRGLSNGGWRFVRGAKHLVGQRIDSPRTDRRKNRFGFG
jgi:hypothetical protein